jgi:hypothetical protein
MKTSAYSEERLHRGIDGGQPRIGIRIVVGVCKAGIFYEILKVRVRASAPSLEGMIIRYIYALQLYLPHMRPQNFRSLGQCLEQAYQEEGLTEVTRKVRIIAGVECCLPY